MGLRPLMFCQSHCKWSSLAQLGSLHLLVVSAMFQPKGCRAECRWLVAEPSRLNLNGDKCWHAGSHFEKRCFQNCVKHVAIRTSILLSAEADKPRAADS